MLYSHKKAAELLLTSYSRSTHINRCSGVQFYVEDHEDIRHINFPGTNALLDWFTNLDFFLKRLQLWEDYQKYQQDSQLVTPYQEEGYKGLVKVHRGYYHAYLSIRKPFREACDTNLKIQINGHSSGGVVAQIAGVDLNYHTKRYVEVVTFGTPKGGNREWRKSANDRIVCTNYHNLFDIVPLILPFNSTPGTNIGNYIIRLNPHSIRSYKEISEQNYDHFTC